MNQAFLYGRKATEYYATTILNFIVKFSASPILKTVMKKAEQISGLFSWCFVFSLIRKKQAAFYSLTDRFLHSSWDHSIT